MKYNLYAKKTSYRKLHFTKPYLALIQKIKDTHNQTMEKRTVLKYKHIFLVAIILAIPAISCGTTGNWPSKVTGGNIIYTATESNSPVKDNSGNYITVVYLENLGFDKIGGNSNQTDVDWLLSQGYRVIELNYANNINAVSPTINDDIIAINDAISSKSFCGYKNCSTNQSYILFEGYRISRNVPYFVDDPSVYGYSSGRDSLYMDIIHPANASEKVPVVLSFSYSNSYSGNIHQRLFLGYTLAMFDDSFLEGAPARGIAWAIADHPKYAPWGHNDTKSFELNPDAAQKVKSAVRTLRVLGEDMGLSGKIGIYGFSRGSDAGSMAVGDKTDSLIENAGFNIGISDDVQAAALGSGVFDFTQIYNTVDDGDKNLENLCPGLWGSLASNYDLWYSMGAAYFVETSASAPVLFFYNNDDSHYYQDQIAQFKHKLDSLGVPTATITNYGKGHAVPKTKEPLSKLYDFFYKYLTNNDTVTTEKPTPIQICMVTIDLETGKNMIVWEAKTGNQVKSYKVYRESEVVTGYELIGTVPFNEISLFVDSTSLPEQKEYRYKISVVDSSNNESVLSNYHKPIFLKNTEINDKIKLFWNKYEIEGSSFNFNNYVVYKGTDSIKLQEIITINASNVEYTDPDSIAVNSKIFYRIGAVKPEACTAIKLSNSEPVSLVNCISNLTDYFKESTVGAERFENIQDTPLMVSPNPASNELQLSFNISKADNLQITMYSLSGNVIYQKDKQYYLPGLHHETLKLTELNLPKGIYYVKVSGKESQGIKKFIKGEK